MLYQKPSSQFAQIYNHFGYSPGGLWRDEIYYIPAKNIKTEDLDNFLSLCWYAPKLFGNVKKVVLLTEEEWRSILGC